MLRWRSRAMPSASGGTSSVITDPAPVKAIPCMVTDSPDGQFLVGRYDERLVVAGGDSGHGFKHCAGLGELLAQETMKEAPYTDASFIDPRRF